MAVRRRSRASGERAALVYAAVEMLRFDGCRLAAGALSPGRAAERRRLVEGALTAAEFVLANHLVDGDMPAGRVDDLLAQLGPAPDAEDILAAVGQILGRPPRFGD